MGTRSAYRGRRWRGRVSLPEESRELQEPACETVCEWDFVARQATMTLGGQVVSHHKLAPRDPLKGAGSAVLAEFRADGEVVVAKVRSWWWGFRLCACGANASQQYRGRHLCFVDRWR